MGYYSVAVILNDRLHDLNTDPHAGLRIASACSGFTVREHRPHATSFGYGDVISQAHSDSSQVLVVGGIKGGMGHNILETENDKYVDTWALEQMAECLNRNGYRVTKRRKVSEKRMREADKADAHVNSLAAWSKVIVRDE